MSAGHDVDTFCVPDRGALRRDAPRGVVGWLGAKVKAFDEWAGIYRTAEGAASEMAALLLRLEWVDAGDDEPCSACNDLKICPTCLVCRGCSQREHTPSCEWVKVMRQAGVR